MVIVLAVSAAWADCPDDAYARVLHAAGRAEYAFASADDPAIVAAATDLRGTLPCVRQAFSAPDAAAVHRAEAFVSFYEGNEELARRAFASARALQPGWEPA